MLDRLETGIPGLDTILDGGLFRGGIYLVTGDPGTGKTILANQICFARARKGESALYVTLLVEAHGKLTAFLERLTFFEPTAVPERVTYVSGYEVLESDGLKGLIRMLRDEARRRKASLLVVDGIATVEHGASELGFRKFIHDLATSAIATGSTTILLGTTDESIPHPEHAIVDGVIELRHLLVRQASSRQLVVRKMRGANFVEGSHQFVITDAGLHLYPRVEAILTRNLPQPPALPGRLSVGIPSLDEMMQGGVPAGSCTGIIGASGAGKTLLGLHFLAAGAAAGEPGLYFGFNESPSRLIAKADRVGLRLSAHVRAGLIEIVWQAPVENVLDEMAERMLVRLEESGARRLFIDGVDGLAQGALYPERMATFLTALTNKLRSLGVTTFFAEESELFGPNVPAGGRALSAMAENSILMRFVELESRLYRYLSIIKLRESGYDPSIREFKIGPAGIELAPTFERAEAILSGTARTRPGTGGGDEVAPGRG
jgi:circadian clock protein KaiC